MEETGMDGGKVAIVWQMPQMGQRAPPFRREKLKRAEFYPV